MNSLNYSSTPLLPLNNIRDDFGIRNVFIKDESRNKFGTIKDRRNATVIDRAVKMNADKVVLITSGNNGYSLGKLALGTQVKVVCIVNKSLSSFIKNSLREVCYQVIEANLDYRILHTEEVISFARERDDEVIWDVTYGYEESYTSIINEILHKTKPDYIVVPIGSGEIFIGLALGLEKFNLSTKLIGLSAQNTTHSCADKLCMPWSPYTRVLQTYSNVGHSVYHINEDDIRKAYTQFKHNARSEPSSTIVYAALYKHHFRPRDCVVFINSGKSAI